MESCNTAVQSDLKIHTDTANMSCDCVQSSVLCSGISGGRASKSFLFEGLSTTGTELNVNLFSIMGIRSAP